MIDLGYPVVAVELVIDDAPGRQPQAAAGSGAPCPSAEIAHQVVSQALANQDYVLAERAARVACELLPGDESAVLDLARVLDARGQVEQARAVLGSFAHSDRPAPVTTKESDEHG